MYGTENPHFSCTFEGLKNNETVPEWITAPTFSTEATTSSDVGDYEVNLINGVAKNYETNPISGILHIIKAQLLITASNKSRLYYEDNPEFTYTCTGLMNSDDSSIFEKEPILSCEATKTSMVGQYPIKIGEAECKNYTIGYEEGTLFVNKRLLRVTPIDATRKYAENNPSFEYTISGFVNSEDINVLLHLPILYTTADSLSDVGTYPIYAKDADAENYSFDYQQATLTIVKADQTITWDQDLSVAQVGDQILLLAVSSSGLGIEYVFDSDIVSLYKVGNEQYLDCLAEGTFAIRATQNGNKNYNAAVRVAKTITISNASGFSTVIADSNKAPVLFDVMGNRILHPRKGQIYIKVENGKKKKILTK